MDIRRKFWLVLIGVILGMVIIACSCGSLTATPTSTPEPPTNPPAATNPPEATNPPVATNPPASSQEAMPGLAGSWNDPDTITATTTTPTVTTIAWENGQYVVKSVINPSRGGNEVTKSSWSDGVLTWTYCVPDGNCITSQTVSVNGDSLDTTWTDDQGNSGETTFERAP